MLDIQRFTSKDSQQNMLYGIWGPRAPAERTQDRLQGLLHFNAHEEVASSRQRMRQSWVLILRENGGKLSRQ